jgi:hypothetical protein
MSERDPFFGGASDSRLRETLEHWADPIEEEGLNEEEHLAAVLDAINKGNRQTHEQASPDANRIVGRRSAARLRLSLPARLQSIEDTHKAILLNISRTGALIAILKAVREGEGGILQCGPLKAFAIVARSDFSINALEFEETLSDAQVLEIRRYQEEFEERERRQLIETARKWVNGDSKDGRAI